MHLWHCAITPSLNRSLIKMKKLSCIGLRLLSYIVRACVAIKREEIVVHVSCSQSRCDTPNALFIFHSSRLICLIDSEGNLQIILQHQTLTEVLLELYKLWQYRFTCLNSWCVRTKYLCYTYYLFVCELASLLNC